jgi:RNA polymerase sigma factor (sigma-70 family)
MMKHDRASTDERLIEIFLDESAEEGGSAFGLLVERYGPMVIATCRRIVQGREDVEDAFQTTFLTLAQKAGAIRNRRQLGPWLHAVARRVASRLQARSRRRPWATLVTEAVDVPGECERHEHNNELREALRSELDRLPEGYRRLIVHCYMEGRSNQEVARLVGCPVGTVKGRLFRARGILRERMRKHEFSHPN